MESCRRYGAPILARGGGTSLAGQCCNVAVVLDFSKYLHNVIDIDAGNKMARVQPGTILDDLRQQAGGHQLTFGPDPATHNHCTLGGMIGNNSCGVHSVMSGRTADNVEELEILTYDGLRLKVGPTSEEALDQIISEGGRRGDIHRNLRELRDRYANLIRERYPEIPRRVSGYNLDQLLPENGFNVARALVGSECTCVLVLEAKLNLVHNPPYRTFVVLGYPDVYTAGDHIPEIMEHNPVGLEGIDHHLVRYMKLKHLHPEDAKLLPEGEGWLLVEFGGETQEDANEQAENLKARLAQQKDAPRVEIFVDKRSQDTVWEIRESGLGSTG